MRLKNAISAIAIVAIVLLGISFLGQPFSNGLGRVVDLIDSIGGSTRYEATVDLYVKKPKQPEHPLKEEFPELFQTESVVVTFGADWCAACRRQAIELKGPSVRFNILKVAIEVDGKKTKWATLMDQLELGNSIPVTVVVSKGEINKVFYGYTPWVDIKPHAAKAKKNDKDDETKNVDIGPIHIDWDDGIDVDVHRRRKPRP